MKKWIALALCLTLCLGLAACGAATPTSSEVSTDAAKVHRIGVIVYNTGDEEVLGFREYLKGYIESNFDMVKFVYSPSIGSSAEEQAFIQTACSEGVEGFLSFLSYDLKAEVELCEKYGAYYLMASGTVSREDFDAVAENPSFLGVFGPSQAFEYQAGENMAKFFIGSGVGNRFFVLSGGAALGNEMHYQRTLGILEAVGAANAEELARSAEPTTAEAGGFTVTVCPGYINAKDVMAKAWETFAAGTYDAVAPGRGGQLQHPESAAGEQRHAAVRGGQV